MKNIIIFNKINRKDGYFYMTKKQNKVMTGILGLLMAGTFSAANAYDLMPNDYDQARIEQIIENHFKTKEFYIQDIDYKTKVRNGTLYEVDVYVQQNGAKHPLEHELIIDYQNNKVIRDVIDD